MNNFVSRLAKNVTTEHVTLEKKIKDVSKHTSNLNTFIEKGETYNITSFLKKYDLFCCIFEFKHCVYLINRVASLFSNLARYLTYI